MDILITDYHCAANRGDAAILEGELEALREEFPEAEFTVMSEYPVTAELMHDVEAVDQKLSPFRYGNLRKNLATSYLLLNEWLPGPSVTLPGVGTVKDRLALEPYYEADIVISTGGQFITDAYFPGKLGVLAEFALCNLLDTPVFVYGQTLGPFDSTPYSGLIRRVLNDVEMIITRDEPSVDYLEGLGVEDPPIYSRADPAFSMSLEHETRPLEHHIGGAVPTFDDTDDLVVSISTRHWPYFETEDGQERYFETIAETADHLVSELDARVVFASTCTGLGGYHTDDRIPAHEILAMMEHGKSEAVELVSGEYTPQQLVSLFGSVDVHIGTRMHSNIFAILGGTAVVPIEYQFKTTGLMERFGLEEYVVDIEGIGSQELIETTERVIEDRESIEAAIEETRPELQEQSKNGAELIAEWVETNL